MWTPQEFPARAIHTTRNDRVRSRSVPAKFREFEGPDPARFKTALFAMSREIIIAPLLDNDGALVAPAAPEQLQLITGPYVRLRVLTAMQGLMQLGTNGSS